jgi:SAM-dependent methyltransferase
MKAFADISEYYKDENLAAAEEAAWEKSEEYRRNLTFVERALRRFELTAAVELGCGTGWMPTGVPPDITYVGVDANPLFLEKARAKNHPTRRFVQEDLRNATPEWARRLEVPSPRLSYCFAVLKHFGLREWDRILYTLLTLGDYSVFEVQLAQIDIDDGTAFHHVSVTPERVKRVMAQAGHRAAEEACVWRGKLAGGAPMWVHVITTAREQKDE